MIDSPPTCESLGLTGRKLAICRGTADLPIDGPHGINSYRRKWGLPPLERRELPFSQTRETVSGGIRHAAPHVVGGQQTAGNVGDCLRDILAECGLKAGPGCSCDAYRKKMNRWGVSGCRQHEAEIIERLAGFARQQTWFACAKVAAHGYLTVRSILDEAIRRAVPTA